METPVQQNKPVWCDIPLEDYEAHMNATQVQQAQLLNQLTAKYLQALKPQACLFLGIAGGNGLEHIDNNVTNRVAAVDINPQYLSKTSERFKRSIPGLSIHEIDIAVNIQTLLKADLVWAALIFEYTGVNEGLAFCCNNIANNGSLIVTIQVNNGVTTVSNTGIESIKKAASVFKLAQAELLIDEAEKAGLLLNGEEENFLPNGKSFRTFHFVCDPVTQRP